MGSFPPLLGATSGRRRSCCERSLPAGTYEAHVVARIGTTYIHDEVVVTYTHQPWLLTDAAPSPESGGAPWG